jgi:hypothetical protein
MCGDPGLPPGIPVMHTIHDPRKTVVNPHNRVGIADYIIHYIVFIKSYIGRLAEYKCHAWQVQLTHIYLVDSSRDTCSIADQSHAYYPTGD